MNILNEENKNKALILLDNFIKSGELVKRKDEFLSREVFQESRKKIAIEIKELISQFLEDKIDIEIFKSKVDSINKRNPLWGFRGIKGQMFFNQLLNIESDKEELVRRLKSAISLPKNIEEAEQKINDFTNFVEQLAKPYKDKRLAPKSSSVIYFLSYFWQIIDPDIFPVYYNSAEQTYKELGFMPEDIEFPGDNYVYFYNLTNELKDLFSQKTGRKYSLWDVEHVYWYYYVNKTPTKQPPKQRKGTKQLILEESEEDYIPPIVKDIQLLASGDENMVKKYEKHEKKIEDVLEDKLYKLFLMLGFETEKLGKGRGRVPDGIARARQEGYAIIYDAKSRGESYNIGTDSRAIKEYIEEYSAKLHREGLKNIYFTVISGDFRDDQDDAIKRIKIDTGVQEVLLLKAELLLFALELKLKDPNIDLGRTGLQQVFQYSGIISKEEILEYLVGR